MLNTMSMNIRTECFFNLTTSERIEIFKRRQHLRLEQVFRVYWGWMMLPLALLGAITTSIYIYVVFKAIRDRRVSRKCYVLILNRALGDLINCFFALSSVCYILLATEINRDIVPIFESFFMGSFWCGTVSYAALSMLKLFAVWKPFHYRKYFTMRRCIYLVVFCWIVFAVIVACTLGVNALVKIRFLNEWSQCRMETCPRQMYRVRNGIVAALYFITLIVFAVTVLIIRKAQRFGDNFKRGRNSDKSGVKLNTQARFPMWKLGLNVATFAGLNAFYVFWSLFSLLNQDQCFFQRYHAESNRVYAFIRCCLILRCILDPTLSFVTDFQLRRELFIILGKHEWISKSSSRGGILQKSVTSDSSQTEPAGLRTQTTTLSNPTISSRSVDRADRDPAVC